MVRHTMVIHCIQKWETINYVETVSRFFVDFGNISITVSKQYKEQFQEFLSKIFFKYE
jgi:hypothetical protein